METTYNPETEIKAMAASLCIDALGRPCVPSHHSIATFVRGPQGEGRLPGMRVLDRQRLVTEAVRDLLSTFGLVLR